MKDGKRTILTDTLAGVREFSPSIRFPGIDDACWREKSVGQELIRTGERLVKEPIPALSLAAYAEFSENGNRVHYETPYFRRRTMLTGLVLAACAAQEETLRNRFLEKIVELLRAILDEPSWCLPAHNSYIRDSKPLPVPDPKRPVIDLFAAETAAILGITEQLLGPMEPGGRIDSEIERRILRPYLSYHFWWMGDGEQSMCNWTPWITQNVLLALFTRREGLIAGEDLSRVLAQAAVSVDYYLDDYGEDGCCNEGAFYYGHSGLCLFGCIDVMNRITRGGMRDVWRDPLIGNIAAYIVKMFVGNGRYFNYSDASPFAGNRSARDYLFGKYTDNADYAAFAAADFRAQSMEERLMPQEENLYYHLLQLSHWQEMEEETGRSVCPPDAWFASTGLMTARNAHWTLAVKAGHNGDSHNHNDIGSLTLYLDEQPFLIDLGVETYTAKTFSDRRYEIWTMQSAYHNTVNFREKTAGDPLLLMQKDGREFAAENIRCELGEKESLLSMEMASAYGDPRVKSCRRTVILRKKNTNASPQDEDPQRAVDPDGSCPEETGSVTIRDRIETDGSLCGVLTFMTYEKPFIMRAETKNGAETETETEVFFPDGIGKICIGSLGFLRFSGISRAAVETCPITDARLATAWKHDCYRILLTMQGTGSEVEAVRGSKGSSDDA
ncbi:MAG: heparinase II/III-family protein [Lachnospiraceae bacterium]|nr:heparinase II/III-family protein [Lachnospiraceae bacterium]